MTNKQYKNIDKVLTKARSQGEITAEELTLARQCINSAEPCLGCQYNDGHNHGECYLIEHCKIKQIEAEFNK